MKRPAEPVNKGPEETTINQVAVAHCIICMQSTQPAGGTLQLGLLTLQPPSFPVTPAF